MDYNAPVRILAAFSMIALTAGAAGGAGAVRAFARSGRCCWAVGDAGLILRSEDAGASWKPIACDRRDDLAAVGFSDAKTGAIFGGRFLAGHPRGASAGAILHTLDAGKTWTSAPPFDAGGLPALHGGWLGGSRAVVFGRPTPRQPGGAWFTVTGGKIWVPVATTSRGPLLGGDFLGERACLVGPAHRIVFLHRLSELRAEQRPIASGGALRAVHYAAADRCWAGGDNGSALRFSGFGKPWQPVALPVPAGTRRLIDIEAVAGDGKGGAIFAGGLGGAVFRAAAGGGAVRRLPGPRPGPVHALIAVEGALLAGGDGGRIWRSGDGGKSWRLVCGREEFDVLFLAGPGDVSVLPALVAHAAAGAETAILYPAVPHLAGGRGDAALRSAGAEAGAGGAAVLNDFVSLAGDPARQGLDERGVLAYWSAGLDVPAREELLRQMAAAIRLYRPKVVALGPDGHEARGTAAESRLLSRLAAEAVRLAGDEAALPELARLGLEAWRVRRVYTGFDANAEFAPPWAKRRPRDPMNVAAEFVGWRYPAGGQTSLALRAQRAAWRGGWIGPPDRPAAVTAYRCSEVGPKRPLFTTGLSPARLSFRPPPVGQALASGAVLAATALLRRNPTAALQPVLRAAAEHPDDPLPADMLYLLHGRLLETGRLTAAADVRRWLVTRGKAHPLFDRLNVAAVAMAGSREWRRQALRIGPPAEDRPFKKLAQALLEPRWRVWVDDEPGAALLGRAFAVAGDFEAARAAYRQLAAFTPDLLWRGFAETELAALASPARAVAAGGGSVAPAVAAPTIDGRRDEGLWKDLSPIKLSVLAGSRGPADVTVRLASAPGGLLAAIRVGRARPASTRPHSPAAAAWRLEVAIDADRDTWTQLLLRCDSTGRRSLTLRTRLAPAAKLAASPLPLQARRDETGWTIELLAPHALLGTSPAKVELLRVQVRVTVGPGGAEPVIVGLAPQADGRRLPHRYALVAMAAASR